MSRAETPSGTPPAVAAEQETTSQRPSRPALRILLVQPAPSEFAGLWLERAGAALRTLGHAVAMVLPAGSAIAGQAQQDGIEVRILPSTWALDPRTARFLRGMAHQWRPDAVLVPDRGAGAWLQRASWSVRLPWTLTALSAGNDANSSTAVPAWRVATGRGEPVEVAAGLRVSAEPIPVDHTLLRRQLRLSRRHTILLQRDAFGPGGGHEVTLRALARLRDRRAGEDRPPQLALLGTGPHESDLHVLSHELELQQQVLWIGSRKDADLYVRAADLLVAPAETSEAPAAIVAALAAGVPVVAAKTAAARALLEHEKTGLLVPPGDIDALSAAIEAVVRDPELASRLARAGREQAAQRWSQERLGRELELLLAAGRLPGRRRRARPAVFVDRDGTLVRNVPYNADPDKVTLEPDAAWVLSRLRQAGCAIVIVTNQSAVARGWCTEDQVRAVHARLVELLRAQGADVDRIEFCPHHPEFGPACACRKPQPGMLLAAARALALDLEASVTIGDEARDLEAGERAGTATVPYAGDWLESGSAALHAIACRLAAAGRSPG